MCQEAVVSDWPLLKAEDSLNMGIWKDESPLRCFLMGRLLSCWWSWLLQDHPQRGIHHFIPSEFVAPGFTEMALLCCKSQHVSPFRLISTVAIKIGLKWAGPHRGKLCATALLYFLDHQQVSRWMNREGAINVLPPHFIRLEHQFDLWRSLSLIVSISAVSL